VDGVTAELQRHTDTLASLSKQTKLLRHLPLEVATLRNDLHNVIAQFPPGKSLHSQIKIYYQYHKMQWKMWT